MLRAVTWNVGGISPRRGELGFLVTKYSPDVVFVQETWLKPGKPTPYIHGYKAYRHDRETRGGGLLTYVKATLAHKTTTADLGRVEALTVIVNHVQLVNIYARPGSFVRLKDLRRLGRVQATTAYVGDWNAQVEEWGDQSTNKNGTYLATALAESELVVSRPGLPTRKAVGRAKHDSTLDFAVTTPDVPVAVVVTLDQEHTTSDHFPVLLTFGHTTPARQFFKVVTDWEGVVRDLTRPWQLTGEVAYDVGHFTASCQAALLSNSRYTPVRSSTHRLLPPAVVQLQQRRRALLKRARATKGAHPELRKEAKHIARQITQLFRQQEQEKIAKELEAIDDPQQRWLLIRRARPRPPPIPTLLTPRGPAVNDLEKAEALADALQVKFVNSAGGQSEARRKSVREAYEAIPKLPPGDIPVLTIKDLENALAQLKVKSSPGPDGVSNKLLKLLPEAAKAHLVRVFNLVLRQRRFPAEWKVAHVTMIHKAGKPPADPGSYRPISLLSCVGKLFERCILRFLNLSSMPNHQFGFRPGHSCTQQLTRLVTDLSAALNLGQKALVVALDVEAAFDKVPHEELLFKLTKTNQPGWLVQLMRSYYNNRRFAVKLNGRVSSEKPIKDSTAQGAVISPPMFNLYISDMPVRRNIGCYQYADDTLYVARGRTYRQAQIRMNRQLAVTHKWCVRWRTKVNAGKSQALQMRRTTVPDRQFPLSMGGEVIPYTDHFRYLGVLVDHRLSFKHHAQHLKEWAQARTGALAGWVACRQGVSTTTKLTLYKTLILSKLLYGLPAWQGVSKAQFEHLRVRERRWIRMITGAGRRTITEDLYDLCPDINIRRDAEACRTKFRAMYAGHENPLVSGIFKPLPDGYLTYPMDSPAPGLF